MLKAYFDDSGTHDGSPVVAFGGFMALEDEWDSFELAWNDLITSYSIDRFHMADCVNRKDQFAGWPAERSDELVIKAIEIIKQSNLYGNTAGMLVKDNKSKLPSVEHCIGQVFTVMLHQAEQRGETVALFLEDHPGRKQYALGYLDELNRFMEGKIGNIVTSVTFASSKNCLPLQAADLFAYETYKEIVNSQVSSEPRPARKSIMSILGANRSMAVQQGVTWAAGLMYVRYEIERSRPALL